MDAIDTSVDQVLSDKGNSNINLDSLPIPDREAFGIARHLHKKRMLYNK